MSLKSLLVVASLVLSVLIGLVLRGEARVVEPDAASSTPKVIKIGLSLDTLKEARWQKDRDAFIKRAQELGAEVIPVSANGDDARQVADIASLITQKVDVLVIVPHDGKAMAKGVELAKAAGIPVIPYDRLIMDSEPDLYATFDNERVGEAQAQFILDQLQDKKPIHLVRIYGSVTDNNAKLFKNGQDKALKKAIESGAVKVVHEDWAEDWKPENAKKIMNSAIIKHGNTIDAVLASNDGTASGAITALKEAGLAGKVVVTGQDAELLAVKNILAGYQTMTIYKPVKKLATRAAELAVVLASAKSRASLIPELVAQARTDNGKRPVPTVLVDVVTVTKDNAFILLDDDFIKREEFTPEELQQIEQARQASRKKDAAPTVQADNHGQP